jgi:hypothetical protein
VGVNRLLQVGLLLVLASCSSRLLTREPGSKDTPVVTIEELRARLDRAAESEVILIGKDAVLDFTAEEPLRIKIPVILKGIRGESGSLPRFLHRGKPLPLLSIEAPDVRIEDLKFEGVETDSKKDEIAALNKKGVKGVYQFPVTRGIEIKATNAVISGCELSGFSHAAIFLSGEATALVEKSSIHHNQRWGLGYGVALHEKSSARISGNRFNWNRHSIAGSGMSGQTYEADLNWFGPDHIGTPLDMHGGKDRGDGTEIAGRLVLIHHNEILSSSVPAFTHRGIPEDRVEIRHNRFAHSDESKAIGYYNGVTSARVKTGKFVFEDNQFSDR